MEDNNPLHQNPTNLSQQPQPTTSGSLASVASQSQPTTPWLTTQSSSPQPFPATPKKKFLPIIGISAGAIIVVAGIIFLVITLISHSSKTVSCNTHEETMGASIDFVTSVKIEDGKISSGTTTVSMDLKTLRDSYKDYEQDIIDNATESYQRHCDEHCVFNQDYQPGDSAKYTMEYDEEGVDQIIYTYGIEDKTAQEIADMVQKDLEDDGFTCQQK